MEVAPGMVDIKRGVFLQLGSNSFFIETRCFQGEYFSEL